MKTSEMNATQKKAFVNIKHACDWLIGGLVNDLDDFAEGSEEYKNAEEFLNDHEALVLELYNMATTAIYGVGSVCYDKRTVGRELRDINFCGKEWLMERCEKRLTKEGY